MLNLGGSKFTMASRRRGRGGKPESLRLTSMIDMFTILLVFLLKSYSADGQIMTVSNDLLLPESSAQKRPKSTPIVTVTNNYLLLDDERVATTESVLRGPANKPINALMASLQEKRQISEALAKQNSRMKFKGEVSIQGDRKIPFRILKRIMMSCGKAGYGDIYLAVTKTE